MTKKATKMTNRRAKSLVSKKQYEALMLGLFIDLCECGDLWPFLDHIGFDNSTVPANADPVQFFEIFKEHYTTDGVLDGDQPFNDFATYPPIARRIVEAQIERSKVA